MGIDAEVGQAYHTVQLSTKEMLKNNQRQKYCNVSTFSRYPAALSIFHFAAVTTMKPTNILIMFR